MSTLDIFGGFSAVMQPVPDPDYIKYLLDPEKEYDCYFVVGNGQENTPVEKIGVVKKFLLAHSVVFRAELDESELKEKESAVLTDIFPDTFKNLLRFVYGFDICGSLSFDHADDLLYVADKYMVEGLKKSLANRLITLLSTDNICSLLNNPACHRVLKLNSEMNKIIQYETREVLASSQFLKMSPQAFLTILEQEHLQVPEMELWRSAIKWAKHRVESDDGPTLREELKNHLAHIRVCTLVSDKDFCREFVCSQVLTKDEVYEVCYSHGNEDYEPELTEICKLTKPRTEPPQYENIPKYPISICCHFRYLKETTASEVCTIHFTTFEYGVQLKSFELYNRNNYEQSNCTVSVAQVGSFAVPVSVTAPLLVHFPKYVFNFPVSSNDDKSVILLPNKKYKVTLTSASLLDIFYSHDNTSSYECGEYLKVDFSVDDDKYVSCIKRIEYDVLKPKWIPKKPKY